MKAYTFVHSYICGIQVGIQAGHAIVELMRLLDPDNHEGDGIIYDWADAHKTFVWLDGGGSSLLNEKIDVMLTSGAPHAYFNEIEMKCSAADEDDAGMITAATVVLTTEQCEAVDAVRANRGVREESEVDSTTWFVDRDGSILTNGMTREEASLIEMVAGARLKSL